MFRWTRRCGRPLAKRRSAIWVDGWCWQERRPMLVARTPTQHRQARARRRRKIIAVRSVSPAERTSRHHLSTESPSACAECQSEDEHARFLPTWLSLRSRLSCYGRLPRHSDTRCAFSRLSCCVAYLIHLIRKPGVGRNCGPKPLDEHAHCMPRTESLPRRRQYDGSIASFCHQPANLRG